MAMFCKKCGGIIPDVVFGGEDRNDCKCHRKPDINVRHFKPIEDKTQKQKEDRR